MVTSKAETPAEYLDQLDHDWRRDTLMQVRQILSRIAPQWDEVMHYGMLGYGPPGEPRMHVNAQKGYVGLYVGDVSKIDPDREMIGGIDCGKGCVRLKKKNPVDDGVEAFLTRYVELARDGMVSDC